MAISKHSRTGSELAACSEQLDGEASSNAKLAKLAPFARMLARMAAKDHRSISDAGAVPPENVP